MPKKEVSLLSEKLLHQNPTAKTILIIASDDQKIIQQYLDSVR